MSFISESSSSIADEYIDSSINGYIPKDSDAIQEAYRKATGHKGTDWILFWTMLKHHKFDILSNISHDSLKSHALTFKDNIDPLFVDTESPVENFDSQNSTEENINKKSLLTNEEKEIAHLGKESLLTNEEKEIAYLGELGRYFKRDKQSDWKFIEKYVSKELRQTFRKKRQETIQSAINGLSDSSVSEEFKRLQKSIEEEFKRSAPKNIVPWHKCPLFSNNGGGSSIDGKNPGKRKLRETRKSKKTSKDQLKNLKETHHIGDKVYASWFGKDCHGDWFPAIVQARKKKSNGRQSYSLRFEDGDDDESVLDVYVMGEEDYRMSLRKIKDKDCFKGLTEHTDKMNFWTKVRGWWQTDMTGDQVFVSIPEAMRARDLEYVKRHGAQTKKEDLNMPDDWEFVDNTPVCVWNIKPHSRCCDRTVQVETSRKHSNQSTTTNNDSCTKKKNNSNNITSKSSRKRSYEKLLAKTDETLKIYERKHRDLLKECRETLSNDISTFFSSLK